MYRRRFSVSGLRNSARSYYYRVQRMRNRRSIFAGLGCLVVGLLVVCCLAAVAVVYLAYTALAPSAAAPALYALGAFV
ncbi:MAG: hypothetical protein IT317_11205 [Anaerolineales bacterium]|nr:hypothetical protein [Anaerolineales bacterium]